MGKGDYKVRLRKGKTHAQKQKPDLLLCLCFFPYSRSRGEAGASLVVKERCKWRTQLPDERFTVSAENYLLFSDSEGNPKMCYRILVRYMAFPNDGYKLHKINWL